MAGNITSIVDTGADAFSNLYDVELTWPVDIRSDGAVEATTSVRIGNFTPPEGVSETYDTTYHSTKITRLKPMITLDRKLTLEFRIDAKYDLYNKLMAWKHLWVQPGEESNFRFGSYSFDSDGNKVGGIIVKPLSSLSGDTELSATYLSDSSWWTFTEVICTKVGTPTYTREGSDAIKVTSEFLFLRMKEPGLILDGKALVGV